MRKSKAPNVPFVEAYLMGSRQRPTAIVIDLSMTTSEKGAALGIATRLHHRNSPSNSYHYMVDEAEVYRGVWDDLAAYSSPHKALNILVCANPHEDVRMWEQQSEKAVLDRTAKLVADLILAYKIKPRYLDGDEWSRWMKRRSLRTGGIIVRVPGTWPKDYFLRQVKSQLAIKA